MKIIHTSDWHLGRRFGPISLQRDQEAFADWFVELCRDEGAELVVIAGDLFDRAIAPIEAIELFRDTVARLLAGGSAVAAITGNHDGADRVAPHGELLDLSRFYLRGGYRNIGEVIRFPASDGPLDLVLLPFLDPQAAPDHFGEPEQSSTDIDDLVDRRRRRTHQSVLEVACRRADNSLTAGRSLAVAHAFVTGSSTSESERDLVVGGTGDVAADLFDEFTYTALGHLHRPQAVSGSSARYSGTPLPYSYSEDHPKSVVVLEMDPDGTTHIATVPVDVGRRAVTLTGEIADLLDRDRHPEARQCFVRAILTDRQTVLDGKARLAEVYPFITEVRLHPLGVTDEFAPTPADVRDLSPFEATTAFWNAAEGETPAEEIGQLLRDATAAALAMERT